MHHGNANHENKNKDDCNFFGNFIPWIEITMNIEAKSWFKLITNV